MNFSTEKIVGNFYKKPDLTKYLNKYRSDMSRVMKQKQIAVQHPEQNHVKLQVVVE